MKKCKKTVVVILALMMLMSSVPSFGATPRFSDVPVNHWAYTFIEKMASLNIIAGIGGGKFNPSGTLTFQEAMILLARLTNPTPQERTSASYAYSSLLTELNVDSWAKEGLAVALYKGIITETELKNNKANIKKPISKVDTGEYLVKAIGLEEVAKSKAVLSSQQIPYKDYLSIQASQLKYVSVLLDIGVYAPEGTGKGLFEPNSTLRRDVMAKMMATAYDYLQKNPTTPTTPEPPKQPEGETVKSFILRISNVGEYRFVIVDNGRGGETAYQLTNNTSITVDGKTTTYTSLAEGHEVELLIKKGTNEILTIKAESVEETLTGKIKTLNSTGYKMTIEYVENKKTITRELIVDSRADIYLDGKAVYLKELKEGDLVVLEVKNNTIYEIEATSKIKKVEGIIKEITAVKDSRDKEYYLTIEETVDTKKVTHKFLINSKTIIYRNNRRVETGEDLKVKDLAYVEGEYDLVNKEYVAKDVDTEVVVKTIKGLIVAMNTKLHQPTEITILNQDSKDTNKEETYTLGKNVKIRVDNVIANSYDLKTGFYVEVVTEGDEIVEIEADSRGLEATILGTISYIDSRRMEITLKIEYFDLDGSKYGDEITVYVKADAVIADRNLRVIPYTYLKRGDRINVIGNYDGSSFIADTIQLR